MNPNEQQSQQPQVEPAENFQYVPPQKQGVPKRVLIIGVILLILLLVLGMLVLSTNRRRSQETNVSPTPTKKSSTGNKSYRFTPAEKTVIGNTTAAEVEKNEKVLEKKQEGDRTIYTVGSVSPLITDEVIVENGVVVSEYTNIKTNQLPEVQLSLIERRFGEPEDRFDKVGDDPSTSGYLYASKGFFVLANRYTGRVFKIQRFTPMRIDEYKKEFPSYIQPAPPYPKEFGDL